MQLEFMTYRIAIEHYKHIIDRVMKTAQQQ